MFREFTFGRHLLLGAGLFLSLVLLPAASAQALQANWVERQNSLHLDMRTGEQSFHLRITNDLGYAHVTEFTRESGMVSEEGLESVSSLPENLLRSLVEEAVYGESADGATEMYRVNKLRNLYPRDRSRIPSRENLAFYTDRHGSSILLFDSMDRVMVLHPHYDHRARLRALDRSFRESVQSDPLSATLLEVYKPPLRDMRWLGQGIDTCLEFAPELLEHETWQQFASCLYKVPSLFGGFGKDLVLVMAPGEYSPAELESPAMLFLSNFALGMRGMVREGVGDFKEGVHSRDPQLLASVVSPVAWEAFKILLPLKWMGKTQVGLPQIPRGPGPLAPAPGMALVSVSVGVPRAEGVAIAGTLFLFTGKPGGRRSRSGEGTVKRFESKLEEAMDIENAEERWRALHVLRKSLHRNGLGSNTALLSTERRILRVYWDETLQRWERMALERPQSFEHSVRQLSKSAPRDEVILGEGHVQKIERALRKIREEAGGLLSGSPAYRKFAKRLGRALDVSDLEKRRLRLRRIRRDIRDEIESLNGNPGREIPEDLLPLQRDISREYFDTSIAFWEGVSARRSNGSLEVAVRALERQIVEDGALLSDDVARAFRTRLQKVLTHAHLRDDGVWATRDVLKQRILDYERRIQSSGSSEELARAGRKLGNLRHEKVVAENPELMGEFLALRALYFKKRLRLVLQETRGARASPDPDVDTILRRLQRGESDLKKSGLAPKSKREFLGDFSREIAFWSRYPRGYRDILLRSSTAREASVREAEGFLQELRRLKSAIDRSYLTADQKASLRKRISVETRRWKAYLEESN